MSYHPRGERIGPALVIEIASPDYILAMKSMTTRKSGGGFSAQELFFERIIDAL